MASEKKYIELEVAKETILNYIGEQTVSKYPSSELCRASRMGAEGAMNELDYAPTADVAEVRHGKWVHTDYAMHWLGKDECSACTYHTFDRDDLSHFNFCPNCGAIMNGDEDD